MNTSKHMRGTLGISVPATHYNSHDRNCYASSQLQEPLSLEFMESQQARLNWQCTLQLPREIVSRLTAVCLRLIRIRYGFICYLRDSIIKNT